MNKLFFSIALYLTINAFGIHQILAMDFQVDQQNFNTRSIKKHAHEPNQEEQLFRAVESNNIERLQELLASGVTANSYQWGRSSGLSALHVAAKQGHVQVITILLDAGAVINLRLGSMGTTPLGETPLILAVKGKYLNAARLLLQRGADANARDLPWSHESPVYLASQTGDTAMVELLLDAGADTEVVGEQQFRSPLMIATMKNHIHIVRLLIERGAKVNAQHGGHWIHLDNSNPFNMENSTALQIAADREDSIPILKMLLRAGANPSLQDMGGYTALHYAAMGGYQDVVHELLVAIPPCEYAPTKGLHAALLVFNRTRIPRDMRKLLIQPLINNYVQEQMQRSVQLLAIKIPSYPRQQTARDFALERGHTELAQMLDMSNPDSYRALRNQVKKKVHSIMFDDERE